MGGCFSITGALCCFLCRSGCDAEKVAAALSMFPPPPYYALITHPTSKKLMFVVDEAIEVRTLVYRDKCEILFVVSKFWIMEFLNVLSLAFDGRVPPTPP